MQVEGARRRRNAVSTRLAILDAARKAFAFYGLDGASVREITQAAGVNGSLVYRYFGSKEQLFEEAMSVELGVAAPHGDSASAISLLATALLEGSDDGDGLYTILALIRSASIERAQPILRDFLVRELVEPLARSLGTGKEATERANLIVASLVGLVILRSVLKTEPLASMDIKTINAVLLRFFSVG